MTESTAVTWLTQEAHDRLSAELQQLTTVGRREIAAKIEAARSEGDLKENGGYHAAREEQAKQEARIAQLTELLRHAVVGEAPPDDGVVEPGMVVTATVAGERMTFLVGSREVAGGTDIDVYSDRSPLGAAIIGRSAGDETSYEAPNGRQIPVVIHEAKPFQP
ncbi:transcription elongation factor GreA [Cellulomonas carbonis]|uniref:Transcription elongation factor GreA n=1 Tax=Cellulomonas carbonis T26 TaxID=947969 RepID=A0A0A0BX17_9CELL|nr:transcription elongation factor GreA [Cellulomonas carbonis]KGM12471.1 transcription elongation factor GreA [Cellulomonas carbonis T26]GGC15566.1 transcription elongation factor GreA [Cellulomonas carbonis]